MPIEFSEIPADLKIPLYWVEIDPSMAGLPTLALPALLVGTALASGDAQKDVPIAVGSQAQADAHFGQGSELSRMFMAYFANNFANMVFGLPVAEPAGSSAATGTLTVTTVPASQQAGTIHLYVGGQHVAVNVGMTDTPTEIADAIATAINSMPELPVKATPASSGGTVTLSCNWKGVGGNDIMCMVNFYGAMGGEILPPGVQVTMPTPGGFLTGGAGVPDFTNAITNLGEQVYEYVALPYTDSNSLMEWETEYGFSDSGRWGWRRQLYGHIFSAKRDTYANLITWGNGRNSGVTSVMSVEANSGTGATMVPGSPSPVYEWTAAYAAKAQRALINDPARPLQTLTLNSILPAPLHNRFDTLEMNSLAENGLATQRVDSEGTPMISRETTTYQLNLYGYPDDAYELVTTLATLARLIRNQRQAITSKYPRCKLADDGTLFGPGQAIVTPGIIKSELIAEYAIDEFNGLVEQSQQFAQYLMVERDTNDPNRLNVLYPPALMNQLRVFAVLAQFRLEYDYGIDTGIASIGAVQGVTGVPLT